MGVSVKALNSFSRFQVRRGVEMTNISGLLKVSLLDDKEMYDIKSEFQTWDEYLVYNSTRNFGH